MQDRAERLRTRSIGVRVTEADFARLHALADARGKLLGEWARDALLALTQHPAGTAVEQALLAEVLALRTIVANLIFAFTSDGASRASRCSPTSSGLTRPSSRGRSRFSNASGLVRWGERSAARSPSARRWRSWSNTHRPPRSQPHAATVKPAENARWPRRHYDRIVRRYPANRPGAASCESVVGRPAWAGQHVSRARDRAS